MPESSINANSSFTFHGGKNVNFESTINRFLSFPRYLAYLSVSILLDEAIGVFSAFPPDGALPDLRGLADQPVEAAQWELDNTWQDTLLGLPEDFQMLECCVHAEKNQCSEDHKLDKVR